MASLSSSGDAQAGAFKTVFERLSALSALERQGSPRAEAARKYLEKFAHRMPGDGNSDQLFSAILRKGLGEEAAVQSEVVQRIATNLSRQEEVGGRQVSPLEALTSPDLSFEAKAGWFEARFLPRYEFLRSRDRQQQPEQAEEISQEQSTPQEDIEPPTPPPSSDDYEQHRAREEKGKYFKRTKRKVHYIYYRCTKKIKPCTQKYLEQNELEKQFRKIILLER